MKNIETRYPDYTKEEFEQRWDRARAGMEKSGMDALLITERINYTYFSGHNSVQNRIDKIRPYVFILPKVGDPVVITMSFESEQVYDTTYIRDIRETGLINHADILVNTLKSMNLENKVIGAELGREQFLGLNFNTYEQMKSMMPDAKFVDAAQLVLDVRVIKSATEIANIKKAATILAESEMETFAEVKKGMTERDVATILRRKIAEKGGENVTFLLVAAGEGPTGGSVLVPTDKPLEPGVTLCLDGGVEYKGCACDICRTAFIGEPTEYAADFYAWMMKLRYEVDKLLIPGNTPKMITDHVGKSIKERGLNLLGVGRVGHGVGCETTEYPSLMESEDITFEPGMVFALNPNFVEMPYGMFNCEDNWAIADENGAELLSVPKALPEIPVIKW